MAKPKVFVTRRIPEPGLKLLEKKCDVEVNLDDKVLTKREIIAHVKDKVGLLCLLTDTIDREIINESPGLKVISNYAVGYDNIDIEAATSRGIPVTNTPGVLTDTTADFAWALLMSISRRVVEADKFTRAGKFKGWAPMLFLGGDIHGKVLGVIGLGRIGSAVAKRARGFDMKVIYYDIVRASDRLEKKLQVRFVPSLDQLLRQADFVTVHVPLMSSTRHMISEHELEIMKNTAYLVNTSRGPVVDEAALVHALKTGKIKGAALDVYEDEPELTPGLRELPNVILAPHIASASIETRSKMALMAAENLLAVLQGKKPANLVNEEVYSK